MENSFNLISVVMILGSVQGLFLSVIILKGKREEGISSYLLSTLLFSASLLFLIAAFHQARKTDILIAVGPIVYPMLLTLGPLLYLYIKSIIEADFKIKIIDILYFFPYFISVLFLARIYFLPYERQAHFIENFYRHQVNIYETIFRYFDVSYRAVFVILSIKILNDFREKLKEEYSGLDKIDLVWLRQLLFYYLITIAIVTFVSVINLDNDFRILLAVFIALIMYVVGYRFIVGGKSPKVKNLKEGKFEKSKYEKSGLTEKSKIEIKNAVLQLFEKDKIFTNPDLTIGKLAEMVNVNRNQLSQVINEKFKKNFYELINGFRIELAKEFLLSERFTNETILSIAFEVGFQSKSTFNAVFKKLTNTTPRQFRKNGKKTE